MSPSPTTRTGKEISQEELTSPEEKNPFEIRTPTRDEVIESSLHSILKLLRAADGEIPDLHNREKIKNMRRLIQTALTDEELLNRFIRPQPTARREWSQKQLPALVRDLASKAGVRVNERQLESFCEIFKSSDSGTIGLYLTAGPYADFPKENLYEAICEYADTYFETKYFLETVNKAKAVIERYFPALYRDCRVKIGISYTPNNEGARCYPRPEAGRYSIWFDAAKPLANQRDYGNLETRSFDGPYLFRRRIADLVNAIHEYAHALYSEETGGMETEKLLPPDIHKTTADAALTEGFAVMIELLSCDMLAADADKLGLDERDLRDLQEWRNGRMIYMLQTHRAAHSANEKERKWGTKAMIYAEGTVKIFHKLYKAGGMAKVIEFLHSIDRKKASATKRTSEEYREALGKPEKLRRLFGKRKD